MSDLYVEDAALKATLDLTGTTYADDDVTRAIEAASRAVETLTGRLRFYLPDDSNDETRYYTAERALVLPIDDAVTVTSVKTDSDYDGVYETVWTLGTDYRLGPSNAVNDGKPYEEIRVVTRPALSPALGLYQGQVPRTSYSLPLGVFEGVQVVGRFGWTACPSQVASAAFIIAEKLVRRMREAPFGVLALMDTAVRVGMDDRDVQLFLRDYDRRPFVV